MRAREAQRLVIMVRTLPRTVPAWVTPEMVVAATPLEGLDLISAAQMRTRRIALLTAVIRTSVEAIRNNLVDVHTELSQAVQ
jgi:hypothetical protein